MKKLYLSDMSARILVPAVDLIKKKQSPHAFLLAAFPVGVNTMRPPATTGLPTTVSNQCKCNCLLLHPHPLPPSPQMKNRSTMTTKTSHVSWKLSTIWRPITLLSQSNYARKLEMMSALFCAILLAVAWAVLKLERGPSALPRSQEAKNKTVWIG